MRDVKSVLGQIVPMLARIQATLDSTLPHLATKAELGELRGEIRAELAEKPGKAYLWAVLCVLIAAMTASYGAGLAAIALLRLSVPGCSPRVPLDKAVTEARTHPGCSARSDAPAQGQA